MYALEEEPESSGRWRRLGAGALISAALLGSLGYGAQRFEPARRLIQKVVQMTVVTEVPKTEKLPPPRTEPPPPPKRAPPPKSAARTAAPPKSDAPPPPNAEPVVGLDEGSFGAGDGASFQVGTTQMGEPTSVARAPVGAPVPAATAAARFVPAGVPPRVDRCRYSTRAQRLGLEGMMVIEAHIDEAGLVTRAELRMPLDEALDRDCLEAVRSARFEPATLGGNPVASTRFLRLRFELTR